MCWHYNKQELQLLNVQMSFRSEPASPLHPVRALVFMTSSTAIAFLSTLNTHPGLLCVRMRTEQPWLFITMCQFPEIDLDHYSLHPTFQSLGFKSMIVAKNRIVLAPFTANKHELEKMRMNIRAPSRDSKPRSLDLC